MGSNGARFRRSQSYGRRAGCSAAGSRGHIRRKSLLPSISSELTDTETQTDVETETVAATESPTAAVETAAVDVFNADGTRKSGEEIRQEYFMAALTGSERGLPVGSFLNDTIEAGSDVAEVAMVWQPYDDKIVSPAGSSLLRSAVDCGALTIDNTFCLTGQCEACMAEIDGEVVLSCMVPVPDDGRTNVEALVCNSDAAWDDMMV